MDEDRDGPDSGLGLYVHVPFCSIKCYYCDFAAFSGQNAYAERYLDALAREADRYAHAGTPDTLYVGGGTPSELTAGQLARLLAIVARRFGALSRLRESTVEANPESAGLDKLDALRRAGVSRLSLGLQTADDALLRSIGRRHSFADFRLVFAAARARGFAVSVDLMLGLPGQTAASARDSLERVLALEPEHLSVYCLQVEDRTLFAKRAVEPDDGLARAMLEDAMARLDRAGFVHYEISNFARPGRESIHNLGYWRNAPYIGLGCGAAGFLGGERWQNEERLARYLARVEAGERPVASAERLSGKEALGEALMLRLRLIRGSPLAPDEQAAFRPELERLLVRGLVSLAGGCSRCLPRLKLTREGVFRANEAFRSFVAPFDRNEVHA